MTNLHGRYTDPSHELAHTVEVIELDVLPFTPLYAGTVLKRVDLNQPTQWAAFNQIALGGEQGSFSFHVPLGMRPKWYCSLSGKGDPKRNWLILIE